MLDFGTQKAFGRIINFGHKIKISPYSYSKLEREVVFHEDRKYWRRIIASVVLIGFYEIFLVVQGIRISWDDEIPPATKIKTGLVKSLYLFGNVGHCCTILYYGEHHTYINAVIKTTNDLHSKLN